MTGDFFSSTLNMIVTSSVAEGFSIFAAALPSDKTMSTKMRLFYSIIPLLSNVILLVLISFVEYHKPNNSLTLVKFIMERVYQQTVLYVLMISILLGAVVFIVLFITKRDKFTDRRLARHYIKMTEKQLPNGEMVLIGGTLDFLGDAPCKHSEIREGKCVNKCFAKGCRKCCWNNGQWRQLYRLLSNGCTIKIMCINPSELERGQVVERLLGILLMAAKKRDWKDKNSHLEIKFFPSKNDPIIRGRIIQQINAREKECCWNFITPKKGVFSAPYIYNQSSQMGYFVIDSLERLFKSYDSIDESEEELLIESAQNTDEDGS